MTRALAWLTGALIALLVIALAELALISVALNQIAERTSR